MKKLFGLIMALLVSMMCVGNTFATAPDDCIVQNYSSQGYLNLVMLNPSNEVMFIVHTPKGREISYNKDLSCPYTFDYRKVYLVDGLGMYKITFFDRVGTNWVQVKTTSTWCFGNTNNKYLVPGSEAESDSTVIKKQALSITSSIVTTTDKAKALNRWVAYNTTYDIEEYRHPELYVYHGAIYSLVLKKGVCHDYAGLTAAMGRSLGIQTKVVHGSYKGGYHAWNQFLIDGRWIPCDSTMNKWDTDISSTDYTTYGDYDQDN